MSHACGRRVPLARRMAILAVGSSLVWSLPVWAQSGAGLRAGLSADPDQFVIGAHVETDPLVENLAFRPNLEVGFGDHLTAIGFNAEFVYRFDVRRSAWRPYVGGGPALNLYRFDADGVGGDTDARSGLNVLFGVEHRRGLFVEAKIGAFDSPDLKFIVGYSFR